MTLFTNRFNHLLLATLMLLGVSMLNTACTDDQLTDANQEQKDSTNTNSFFSNEINQLIDANYPEVQKNGHSKLVIPKSMYKDGLFTLTANSKSDMDVLVKAGYKVYVNGGTVRDGIMGAESHDVDCSTNCDINKIAEVLPNAKAFNAFRNIWIAKAYHDTGLETDIAPIFAIFPELSGKEDVPTASSTDSPYSTDLLEDTYSRDFTFNAMYYDYATGDIIDYHGGLHDMREGIVRTVFNANLAVSNDPRKFFRSCRFAAKFNFKIADDLDQAMKDNYSVLGTIDAKNTVYQTSSGFNGGFALRFYKFINNYKITDFFLTSMAKWQHTDSYEKFVEGMLASYDSNGKQDVAMSYAALFWPRVAEELAKTSSPTSGDVDSIWTAIDKENAAALRFEKGGYADYSYAPAFMKDIWWLQVLMTSDSNMTTAKATEIKAMTHYKEAVTFLNARASMDDTLKKYAEYWK